MKSELEEITKQALTLPPSGRARLAEALLESLDYEENFPISGEWKHEILRRCQELDDGSVQPIDGDTALHKLQQKYS